ncbi:gamma-glutamyltransferase, partial [Nostoc sp. 3335mG]
MRIFPIAAALLATVSLGGCNLLPKGNLLSRSKPAAAPAPVAPVAGQHQKFVVSANPLASEAGMAVLRRGGRLA